MEIAASRRSGETHTIHLSRLASMRLGSRSGDEPIRDREHELLVEEDRAFLIEFSVVSTCKIWAWALACLASALPLLYGVHVAVVRAADDPWDRNRRAVYACVSGWSFPGMFAFPMMAHFSRWNPTVLGSCVVVIPGLFLALFLALYYQVGHSPAMSGAVVSTLAMVTSTVSSFLVSLLAVNAYRSNRVVQASVNAQALESGVRRRKISAYGRAAVTSVPVVFCFGVGLVYIYAIFEGFNATDSTAVKSVLTLLSMAIKVVGNKLQLNLVLKYWRRAPVWLQDVAVYLFEVTFSLLSRILIFSNPNITTAQLLALTQAVLEVMSRLWFSTGYQREAVVHERAGWPSPGYRRSFRKTGYIRAIDINNNMVTEYVTAIVAAGILYYLPSTGAFRLTVTATKPLGELAPLVLLQVLPEMVVDVYATLVEVRMGLLRIHRHYWSQCTWKGVVLKVLITVMVTSFCLCVCIKG